MARTRRHTPLLWCSAAVLMSAGSVGAQVAPPAEAAPEQAGEYVPPAPPPTPPQVQPTRPAQGEPGTAPQRRRVVAPDIPFRSMAVEGADGRIARLSMPPHLVALKHNNTIADNSRDEVMPVLHARQNRVEERLLANYDLFLGFEGGWLEQVSLEDIGELQRAVAMVKPLIEPGDVSLDLEDAGVFSASQRTLNGMIVQDYQKKVTDEVRLEAPGEIGPLFRQIIEDSLVEPRFAFRLMLAELVRTAPEAVEKADLTESESVQGVLDVAAKGWPEGDERLERVREMRRALSRLSPDEQERLLRASRELREDPAITPLPEIALAMPGVVGVDNFSGKLRAIREHDEQGNPILPEELRRPGRDASREGDADQGEADQGEADQGEAETDEGAGDSEAPSDG